MLLCIRIVCSIVADAGASRSDRSPVMNKNVAPACASWRSEQYSATPTNCVPQLSVEDSPLGRFCRSFHLSSTCCRKYHNVRLQETA